MPKVLKKPIPIGKIDVAALHKPMQNDTLKSNTPAAPGGDPSEGSKSKNKGDNADSTAEVGGPSGPGADSVRRLGTKRPMCRFLICHMTSAVQCPA